MLSVNVSKHDRRPLVDQIVSGIRREIDSAHAPAGTRLPSIRDFARRHEVSRFTVVEAYDRLVAMGYIHSRRGAGFFAAPRAHAESAAADSDPREHHASVEWLIRRLLDADERTVLVGGPWLPGAWLEESGLRKALAGLARRNGRWLTDYGNPFGYLPLREHLAVLLSELDIAATPSQIVLTHGTSEALDLVIRTLLASGDAVLVDDPGYYNLFGNLRHAGVRMLGVTRTPEGPDLECLERLAAAHQPKIYFTQSTMHNPTGSSMSAHASFRVLQLAERHDFRVVEDDIFSDLQEPSTPRLASADRLERVIYVRSFSKTLSGSLRMGFVACSRQLANAIAETKMVTSITSSQCIERLVYVMLVEGHYRKFLGRIRQRVDDARGNVIRAMARVGVELFTEPRSGMFLWGRIPGIDDTMALAERALEDGYLLAPGRVFRPHLEQSPWMRFNVTACDDTRVESWLAAIAASPSIDRDARCVSRPVLGEPACAPPADVNPAAVTPAALRVKQAATRAS